MPLGGLWLPPSAQEKKPKRKTWLCLDCGREYPRGGVNDQKRQWALHTEKCAERNSAKAEAYVEAQESSIFTSVGDRERFAFIRKHGNKKALRRRRSKA